MLDQKRDILSQALPHLSSLYQQLSESRSLIKHYQGIEGIKAIYSSLLDTLNVGDYYLVISDQQKWYELDPVFFERFIKKRAALKLDLRLILQKSSHALEYQKKQDQYNEKIKIISEDHALNVNTVITPNQIIYIQIVPPLLGLVIENENIVKMNKTMFDVLWHAL